MSISARWLLVIARTINVTFVTFVTASLFSLLFDLQNDNFSIDLPRYQLQLAQWFINVFMLGYFAYFSWESYYYQRPEILLNSLVEFSIPSLSIQCPNVPLLIYIITIGNELSMAILCIISGKPDTFWIFASWRGLFILAIVLARVVFSIIDLTALFCCFCSCKQRKQNNRLDSIVVSA